jgi:hypothetical protein
MAEAKHPNPDKLICGILFNRDEVHHKGLELLQSIYGPIDLHLSNHIPFTFTNYYEKQMGQGLQRCFISFQKLIDPSLLSEIKKTTNEIEKNLSKEYGLRIINLDPGLLNPSRFILASAKNYAHRIYLKDVIYVELEYLFDKKGALLLPWTYPDYKTQEYQDFFIKARKILLAQLKENGSVGESGSGRAGEPESRGDRGK